jgi:alpha,alpha-trehalase
VNRYKVSKQADVLMLFYLFTAGELRELFERLGYPFGPECIPRNVEYYSTRTAHGSTLSRIVSAWVTARSDRAGSWRLFQEALESDISDIQGGSTAEGIHLGAMAGSVDVLHCAYLGIATRENRLWLDPCLPDELDRIRMTIRYRGMAVQLDVTRDELTVRASPSNPATLFLCIQEHEVDLASGEMRRFSLRGC